MRTFFKLPDSIFCLNNTINLRHDDRIVITDSVCDVTSPRVLVHCSAGTQLVAGSFDTRIGNWKLQQQQQQQQERLPPAA